MHSISIELLIVLNVVVTFILISIRMLKIKVDKFLEAKFAIMIILSCLWITIQGATLYKLHTTKKVVIEFKLPEQNRHIFI